MRRTCLLGLALALVLLPAACWKKHGDDVPLQRIKQRSYTDIAPGVRMWLGDIKTTNVAVVITANGKVIASSEAAVEGDVVPFTANGSRWEVQIARLESHLTHEDWAHVRVRKK
jgi:hypothetical protein